MINHKLKRENEGKASISPLAAAVTGAVVGAGVAIAGAVALKDDRNNKKIKETLNSVKDQAKGYMKTMQVGARDKKVKIEKKASDKKEKVKEATDSTKDTLNKTEKGVKKTTTKN